MRDLRTRLLAATCLPLAVTLTAAGCSDDEGRTTGGNGSTSASASGEPSQGDLPSVEIDGEQADVTWQPATCAPASGKTTVQSDGEDGVSLLTFEVTDGDQPEVTSLEIGIDGGYHLTDGDDAPLEVEKSGDSYHLTGEAVSTSEKSFTYEIDVTATCA